MLYLEKIIKYFNNNIYIKKMQQNFKWFDKAILYILTILEEKNEFEKLNNLIYQIDAIRKIIKELKDQ